MATKNEMRESLLNFYDDYHFFLNESGITVLTYTRWVQSFLTHEDISKAYNFVFGKHNVSKECLKAYTLACITVLRELDRNCIMEELIQKWLGIKLSGINTDAILKYKLALKFLKNKWSKRLTRKRNSE